MTNPLSPLKYGKVVGKLLAGIIDSPDVGDIPDFPPLEGRVTFTANVPKFLVGLADPPATVVPLDHEYYTCVLDDEGFLTWRGDRGVFLAAPIVGTMNPSGWTWTVSFDLSYLGVQVPVKSFALDVPEYVPGPDPGDPDTGAVGLVDLTVVSPVPASEGDAVVRGVSVASVSLSVNDLIFGLDNGTFLPGVTVPSIAASAASATAAAASATAAAGSATAAANSANSFGLNVISTTTGSPGSSAAVVVSGTAPSYHLAFTVPRGDVGAVGPSSPDATASVKGIIQLAGDLAGSAAAPTAPNKVDKLTAVVKTANYTMAPNDFVAANASGGTFTVTFPAAPADKTRVAVKKVDSSTNAVSLALGGSDVFNIASGPTSGSLVLPNQALIAQYSLSSGIWYVQSTDIPLSGTDTRYAALQLATAVKTTTYTAVVGDFVPADATSAGFTVTLPSTPADGSVITVKKIDSSANIVTVSRAGSDVFNVSGGATTSTLTKQNQAERYVYHSGIWYTLNHISNSDSRLSDTRTPAVGTVPYDLSAVAFGKSTTRAAGTGDFPFGVKMQRAVTFTSVTYRAAVADASGNLVVKLQKNGSDTGMTGSSVTIAAASQVAGGTGTGTWSFAAGDILTVVVVSVGTTPGAGLIADITGLA